MQKRFFVFNSFTDQSFCGNPAGVVPDADDLTDQQMQLIARQLNLVETVFILKPQTAEAHCRFRYFMPAKELPIAGHPTIAGWAALRHLGKVDKTNYVQETAAGNITIQFKNSKIFTSQKTATIKLLDNFSPDDFSVFGLTKDDVVGDLPVAHVDAGLGHIIFAVKSLDTLMQMRFTPDELDALCKKHGARECQIFCLETKSGLNAHTRNLCPRLGLEDPACGNGNAALGAYFQEFVDKNQKHLAFEQGHIVNMPAIIEVLIEETGIMIGGNVKFMAEGMLEL